MQKYLVSLKTEYHMLWISLCLVTLLWGLSSCQDSQAPLDMGVEDQEGSRVSFAIRLSKLAVATLARAEVVITASDMEEIRQDLTISGELATGTVEDIPAGNARLFTLNGYDAAGTLIYSGSSEVDLPAGEVVPVQITMRRVDTSVPSGKETTIDLPGGATMEMVLIEPGSFRMGSSASEVGHNSDESPLRTVTISKGFYLGKYEVTQAQWESVIGTSPWFGQSYVQSNLAHPAVYISWEDAQEFIHQLNVAAGDSLYRLPTEAEWEYACRAGTNTPWSFGDDESQLGEYAWYKGNTSNVNEVYAHAVGTKLPNPWGLHDMHGNVYEWVQDWYGNYSSDVQVDPTGPASGSYRVSRGGGFINGARYTRSPFRFSSTPSYRSGYIGVRLLRTE